MIINLRYGKMKLFLLSIVSNRKINRRLSVFTFRILLTGTAPFMHDERRCAHRRATRPGRSGLCV
ncbi:Hypothetical protein ETEE_0601 [Edwardsiella anguillarum ET080813]|uniref:Uncharacterized protein n=1 Tax=Edwardsiella anguillarum ET080813 TaxID=667120 RepID=A0A076LN01_9GAMM|nr:Hypothetical protein ETEE_0601 [Edwardsiella anguillarum ET080813]